MPVIHSRRAGAWLATLGVAAALAFGGGDALAAQSSKQQTNRSKQKAAAEAERAADGLADAVRDPVQVRGVQVAVAASIGISTSPADGADFAALLHAADVRMYAAKGSAAR